MSNPDFTDWWSEYCKSVDNDTPMGIACSDAWDAASSRATPMVVDAYHRGRRAMLIPWLIGTAGVVLSYVVMRYVF